MGNILSQKKYELFDIVVVGGGLAGVAAAIAAARENKRVALIERYGFFGGMATTALVNPFMNYCANGCDTVINAGIFQLLLEKMYEYGATKIKRSYHFNEQMLKIVLDDMVRKYENIKVFFHSFLNGATVKNGTIEKISIATISGNLEISGRYFIDASGDGLLAAFADVPFEIGDDKGGECQPMTTCFNLVHVDWNKFDKKKANEIYARFQAEGKIKNPRDNILVFTLPTKAMMHFNTTRIVGKNPLDVDDITETEFAGREQVMEMFRFLKENVEGFEDSELVQIADQVGVRESRRICGEYRLNEDDILSLKKFDDGVARCSYDIDIHHSHDGHYTCVKLPQKEWYTIPYRSLIPIGISNLLIAGRSICSSHVAQSSFRIMPVTTCIGEAAGLAVSLACEKGSDVRDIEIVDLHKKMNKYGCLY